MPGYLLPAASSVIEACATTRRISPSCSLALSILSKSARTVSSSRSAASAVATGKCRASANVTRCRPLSLPMMISRFAIAAFTLIPIMCIKTIGIILHQSQAWNGCFVHVSSLFFLSFAGYANASESFGRLRKGKV